MLSGGGTQLARRRNTMRPQARTAISLLNNFTHKHIFHYVIFQDSNEEQKNPLFVQKSYMPITVHFNSIN